MSDAPAVNVDNPVDALDSLEAADREVGFLVDKWRHDTATLEQGDDVDVRWERGSAAKLLLQQMAVRESAKDALAAKLRADGHTDLAERIEGDRAGRRQAISDLDHVARQRQAIVLNTPEVDRAVRVIAEFFDREREDDRLADDLAERLGPSGERGLPSTRVVQATAQTDPRPDAPPKKPNVLMAVRALYQHLRDTPTGGTAPSVDSAREHMPGPEKSGGSA
ncbi:MAG TPA: hypothetical protein VFP61_05585 [Acidimicrobiales bacterium]|nr:hypothetical protein [Acidimicrobiales bacterium]